MKTPVLESLFDKVADLKACECIKIDSNTGFFCEYCKIFKNSFFYRTPLVTASVVLQSNLFCPLFPVKIISPTCI